MVQTGYMIIMRVLGKKLEWSPSFKVAFQTIEKLNNTYFIDGRDPNSYAGVLGSMTEHGQKEVYLEN